MPEYHIIEENGGDLKLSPWVVKMMNKELDGLIVRDALDEGTIASLLGLFKSGQQHHLPANFGSIWSAPFATVNGREQLEEYKTSFAGLVDHWEEARSEDPQAFINQLFGTNCNSKVNDQLSVLSIRQYNPEYGGINFHCGRHLQRAQPFFYRHYFGRENFRQLSYFIVLQEAEKGGDLNLYDLRWDSDQKFLDDENGMRIQTGQKTVPVTDISKAKVDLRPGDLFVFNGSEIWHEVDDIHGQIPRITLGGFMSLIDEELAVWS
jgi:hypothetical protein